MRVAPCSIRLQLVVGFGAGNKGAKRVETEEFVRVLLPGHSLLVLVSSKGGQDVVMPDETPVKSSEVVFWLSLVSLSCL